MFSGLLFLSCIFCRDSMPLYIIIQRRTLPPTVIMCSFFRLQLLYWFRCAMMIHPDSICHNWKNVHLLSYCFMTRMTSHTKKWQDDCHVNMFGLWQMLHFEHRKLFWKNFLIDHNISEMKRVAKWNAKELEVKRSATSGQLPSTFRTFPSKKQRYFSSCFRRAIFVYFRSLVFSTHFGAGRLRSCFWLCLNRKACFFP